MSEINPAAERYLTAFAEALVSVPAAERAEMVGEIRSHIGEALRAGRDTAEVLEKLGPAERLAAAYRAELLLNRPRAGAGQWVPRVGLMGALAGASLVSLCVICCLSALALSFIVSGVAVFLAGVGLPLFPPEAVNTPFTMRETQIILMVVGAVCAAIGGAAAMGLQAYIRFAGRAVQNLLGRIRTTPSAAAV